MAMKARYTVIDGEVIAEKRNGARSLYVPDPLGSTVALLDNTQAQTDTFSYWPYGENNARTGTTATPFQFVGTAGYYRDNGTRTHVRARTLNTQQGRWMTKDPIGFEGGDWNLYGYCGDGPVTTTDATGLQAPLCGCGCQMILGTCSNCTRVRVPCAYLCTGGTVGQITLGIIRQPPYVIKNPITGAPILSVPRPSTPSQTWYWCSYASCTLISGQPGHCPIRTRSSTNWSRNKPTTCLNVRIVV
jgi:RHS repeat-associated protein